MLLPTSVDVLRSIERTLETVIAPALTGTGERSALATIGHLLRHVALRIELEGQMLVDDIAAVRPLLAQVDGYLESPPRNDAEGSALRARLAQLLSRPAQANGYRSVANLAEEVTALRQGVCEALDYVQTRASDADPQAKSVLDALLRYVAWETEQEAKIIDPAFEGFGPRR
jgi:hypothetical protein